MACYISPNDEEFVSLLEKLDNIIAESNTNIVIGGDFNSKTQLWGCDHTNSRGEELIRWAASRDMVLMNEGNKATCIRPQGISIVDLTWSDANISLYIKNWHVMDNYYLIICIYILH